MGFLQDKRILIVGVASNRSIAWGIAEAMHREGAQLAFTYQSDKLKSRVEECAEKHGAGVVLPLDVGSDEQIEKVFADLGATWDGLDGIVHSVAFAPKEQLNGSYIDAVSREGFATAHDISSYSFAALAKAGRPMMAGRNGSLLTLSYLGVLHRKEGDYDAALRHHFEALEILEGSLPDEHPRIVAQLRRIATTYSDRGDYPRAIEHYQRALTMEEGFAGPEHPRMRPLLEAIGVTYKRMGRYDDAVEVLGRAHALTERTYGPSSARTAHAARQLANALRRAGQLEAAQRRTQRAIEIWEGIYDEPHPQLARAYESLGLVLRDLDLLDEAERALARALAIHEAVDGGDGMGTASAAQNLANLLRRRGEHARALALAQRAHAIVSQRLEPGSSTRTRAVRTVAHVAAAMGDRATAREWLLRALDEDRSTGRTTGETAEIYLDLAEIEREGGRRDAWLEQARRAREELLRVGDAGS